MSDWPPPPRPSPVRGGMPTIEVEVITKLSLIINELRNINVKLDKLLAATQA